MAQTYIPTKDQDLKTWALNFSTLIAATPTAFGLVAADATIITQAYNAFATALTTASNPATRTPAAVAQKDAAKSSMLNTIRPYAQRINLNAGVTDQQRSSLGITIRKTIPTPVPPPTTAPALSLKGAIHGTATLAYKDPALPAGKAKPYGVTHIELFVAAGTMPAIDPSQAQFVQSVTKSPFVLSIPALQVGKTLTVYGRYSTRSGPGGVAQAGPFSAPLVFTGI